MVVNFVKAEDGYQLNYHNNKKDNEPKATITQYDLSPDSFVLMLCYSANLKAIRYEPTSLNGIVADKPHRVIVA